MGVLGETQEPVSLTGLRPNVLFWTTPFHPHHVLQHSIISSSHKIKVRELKLLYTPYKWRSISFLPSACLCIRQGVGSHEHGNWVWMSKTGVTVWSQAGAERILPNSPNMLYSGSQRIGEDNLLTQFTDGDVYFIQKESHQHSKILFVQISGKSMAQQSWCIKD